jgi:hypothetical protein
MPAMSSDCGITGVGSYSYWSMKQYLSDVEQEEETPELENDGLERSIIVKLADDCKIAVKSGSVQMCITKKFEKTGFINS